MRIDSDSTFSHQNNSTIKFTPRELIRYHIEHPEVPITDKDIENLILDNVVASNWNKEYQALRKENNATLVNSKDFNKVMLF